MAKKIKKQSPAEPMPGLVFNEATETKPEPSPWDHYNARHSSATRYMWIGVISLSIIIVGLWAWSLRLQMAFVGWKDLKENKLISQTKADWNKVFSNQSKNDLQTAVEAEQTRQTIQNIITARLAAAALTSPAPAIATTTAPVATTTPKTYPTTKKSTKNSAI